MPSSAKAPDAGFAREGFDESDALPISCTHCNAPMPADEDLCDQCGYHRILKKTIDLDGVHRQDKTVGFERVVSRHLDRDTSAENMLLWAKIVGGFFAVGFLLLCLGKLAWIVLALIAVGVAYYYLRRAPATDEETVNQDPIATVVWRMLLVVQRALGWRRPDRPLKRCRVLVMRDPSFNDEQLADLENLTSFEALDLEGTAISDEGLPFLEDLQQLSFLVLKGTRVTSEGIRRLQQKLPQTWIWE